MNPRLAWFLAWRSLRHRRTLALATVLGVAIGMTVVTTILIVDHNSLETRIGTGLTAGTLGLASSGSGGEAMGATPGSILRVSFERGNGPMVERGRFPTQEGQVKSGVRADAPPPRRGEEDYQAMRLAVRLASLMAFAVGAVIVFYTMGFSVASRGRELSLLLCLGERRRTLALSLLIEAAALGLAGTLTGLLLAFPAASALIEAGISTTGRVPSRTFAVPWRELAGMGALSLAIALLGVAGPLHALYRMRVVEVLQPRFISPDIDDRNLQVRGFGWLLPPLMAAAYLALRPFLRTWLSVVEFFVLEALFAGALAILVLWSTTPLLRGAIRVAEWTLRPLLPLETLLVGQRLRLTSRKLVFTLVGVTLVFSLLTALHDIASALKNEIATWSLDALSPYVFLRSARRPDLDEGTLQSALASRDLQLFRLSRKVEGEFPLRLVAAADVNPYLAQRGRPSLGPARVLASRTLAARFDLAPGDRVLLHTEKETHRFALTEIADDIGFFADDGQYVDLKSWFVFSDGNPLFAGALERTLGDYAVLRKGSGGIPGAADLAAIKPYYYMVRNGAYLGEWQQEEIDRDFLIFDFILIMTLILAAVGVANGILIQVHAREREFSVLRTLGVSRAQTTRLLLVEGAIVGLVSALLALVLGHTVGAISIAFLDRFTLFDYAFAFSPLAGVLISLLAVVTCSLAAIYPALVANRISSAESLHYE